MRSAWLAGLGAVATIGCGRLGFDDAAAPADDASPDGNPETPLLAGCMFRMQMDEPAWNGTPGEVVDSCGRHDGTATGGATTALDPQRGRVGEFAGGTSCVQVADATALQPGAQLTVSAWILPTALAPQSFGIVSRRTDFQKDTVVSVFLWTDGMGSGNTNEVYVDLDTENDRVADPTTTYLNAWRQITVVYDGARAPAARVQFYVDGQLTFTAAESSASIGAPAGAPPLSIGCLPLSTPAQSWVGRLDDVVLWSRALSSAEVAAWYGATKK